MISFDKDRLVGNPDIARRRGIIQWMTFPPFGLKFQLRAQTPQIIQY